MTRRSKAYLGGQTVNVRTDGDRLILSVRDVRKIGRRCDGDLTFGGVTSMTADDPRSPDRPPSIRRGWRITEWVQRPGETEFVLWTQFGPGDQEFNRFVVRHATFENTLRVNLRATLRSWLGLRAYRP